MPVATYRLQFNRNFTFADATFVLDYLQDLGVTDCYASPLFQAGPQSTHGYDICRFDQLNPNLGTPEQFEQFTSRLNTLGMGLLLDMVPNHMRCDCSNPWWTDVLKHGRNSRYAAYFDIDWSPPHTSLRDKVLLPVLEDHYQKVLKAGKLRLQVVDGEYCIAYYDKTFPLSLGSLEQFRNAAKDTERLLSDYNGSPEKLDALLSQQHYQLAYWRDGLEQINYRRFFDVMELVAVRIELPEVFDATHQLAFQLIADGKVTGLRIDHPDGLWDPTAYLARLQEKYRAVVCLRPKPLTPSLSHPMGEGVRRTVERGKTDTEFLYVLGEKILSGDETPPSDWPIAGTTGYDFLNCVNGLFVDAKNSDAMDRIYREFTGRTNEFQQVARDSKRTVLFTSFKSELRALIHCLKELADRTEAYRDISLEDWAETLAAVIVAFPVYRTYATESSSALDPPQRAYVEQAVDASTRSADCQSAVSPIANRLRSFEFLRALLLLDTSNLLPPDAASDARRFVMKFQQLTGPVMAKGLEDTAFYRFNRLVSLNEVGVDPDRFGIAIDDFHAFNARQLAHWPHSLLATATHDTKRGEEVRARINVLSEIPDEWADAVQRWRDLNQSRKRFIDGEPALRSADWQSAVSPIANRLPAPSANDEYLFYQTAIGACPFDTSAQKQLSERLCDYMVKAVREAKLQTNWLSPNLPYEDALTNFVKSVLADAKFLDAFLPLQQRVSFFGKLNSLSQTLLKITSPGVPDLYQGTELWDLSLVDPDNRRPVDYELRRRLLDQIRHEPVGRVPSRGAAREITQNSPILPSIESDNEGRLKLHLIYRTLQFRNQHRDLFERGDYVPINAHGPKKDHLCAFARKLDNELALVIAPRLVCTLLDAKTKSPLGSEVWHETYLLLSDLKPRQTFQNILTGETVKPSDAGARLDVGSILSRFPAALLHNTSR